MPIPQTAYLAPPPITKNFLISPPGSPPEGWEPIIEEPPNDKTLAEDLAGALEKVQLERREWGWDDEEPIEVEETFDGADDQPWEQRMNEQERDNRRTSFSNPQKPSPPHLCDSTTDRESSQSPLTNGTNPRTTLPATGSQVILQTSTGVIVSVLPPPPAPPALNGLFASTATIPRIPTAMPPRDISQVKATVESMQRREEGREADA
ncbi:hypothetical protein QFC24_001946 [Naganishia onofrii]|uniref:Uncharacterized protein n=1 Tax=Naganishia onofrii TaxID=1851511 RepID=A0ACC2XQS7_9TREE|nr:hypothetical protein QFC24_001946 [Naganishia onofrii]